MKLEKLVMAAQTGPGRRLNHRARRMLILLLVPVVSEGKRLKDLISVRASDGR